MCCIFNFPVEICLSLILRTMYMYMYPVETQCPVVPVHVIQ
jgi:hypothetical protein